jgi:hypothetical protein
MCFVWFSVSTAITSKNSVNQLVFVMVKCGAFFAVRTEFLNSSARSVTAGRFEKRFHFLVNLSFRKVYRRTDHPTLRRIVEYHRKNIFSKPKNISHYSNLFKRYSSGFYPFLLYEYMRTPVRYCIESQNEDCNTKYSEKINRSYLHSSTFSSIPSLLGI